MMEEKTGKGLRLAAAVFGLLLVTVVAATGMHPASAWEEEKCPPGLQENPAHDQDGGMENGDHSWHEDDDCR